MIDIVSIAKKYFEVSECDIGEYSTVKGGMIKAKARKFTIDGVGSMALQDATAMLGMMKMNMMVITPLSRDLPMFSFDIIDAIGNYTIIIEIYDMYLNKSASFEKDMQDFEIIKGEYKSIPDNDLGEHWYDEIKLSACVSKKAKKKDVEAQFDGLFKKYLEKYFEMAKSMDLLDESLLDEKREKSAAYVDGLLKNGGPSTDQFVKMIGEDKTRDYFTKVIFGTAK